MRRFACAGLLLVCAAVYARTPEGRLDLIQTPNNGLPVIITPGQTFSAILTEEAELRLEGNEGTTALSVSWTRLSDGRVEGVCVVPGTTVPGRYALVARTEEGADSSRRAVFVLAAFPKRYTFAHISDVHVGSNRHARSAEAIFRDIIAVVNASEASFALLTGDITENGTPEQFQRFLEVLDTCRLPTFVCPGNHDRKDLNYERFCGPLTYWFRFGPDGYLAFDTKDFNVADELRAQDADLEVFRRAIKPARWSIGFSHRYESDMGMRSQLVLFVDDPLDHFLCGHTHRANRPGQETVPWGTTPITVTPAAVNGVIRYFDVTPLEVIPGDPERVAETE